MTKTFVWLFVLELLLAPAAIAQQFTPWEIYGGYSLERSGVRQYYKSTPIIYTFREQYINLRGWEVSVNENANSWVGGTLQLNGHYRTENALGTRNHQSDFSILYGPRLFHRIAWITPFAHALFGATHESVTSPGPHASETEFAFAGGAGLDLNLSNNVGFRVFQVQYSPKNVIAAKPNKYQASAGVVVYLGKRK